MQGPSGLLNIVTIPPGASITSQRLVLDGVRGAIFVYTSGGPTGALIGSWAGMAGTDPYGNAYPAGLNVSQGSITGVTFNGTNWILNNSGLFFYSGTPANGNMIISIAPASGTDAFSNNFPAGIQIYGTGNFGSSSGNNSSSLSAGTLQFFFILANLLTLNNSGVFLYTGAGGSGALIAAMGSAAGTDQYGNTFPKGIYGQQLTLQNQGSAPPAFSGASIFYSGSAGRPRFKSSSGNDNVIQRADVNVTQVTVGNQTAFADISSAINYAAGEGAQSSEYEIEIDGVITTASAGAANTLSFRVAVDGTTTGGQCTMGAVFLVIASTFAYTIRGRVYLITGGAGGTCAFATDGGCFKQGVNAGSSTTPVPTVALGANSGGAAGSFDSTVAHTITLQASWGGLNAGQTLTTFRSRLTRRN